MLVLDAELSASQMRNLEDAAGIAICDREAIILNVFLRHARTRRAKIQVEIAQLEYLRPRIRGVGLDMDQQTGGSKNARGPGETASELLARKLDSRLAELRKGLTRLETSAKTQRQQRVECQRLVLVGYTNAGKTSLMNALTSGELSARDMPFETLDTTSRCLTRHGGEVVISDTVGFIRRLPERLLASFDSTLSEIGEASLLVIVVDASDYERELQIETTLQILQQNEGARDPALLRVQQAGSTRCLSRLGRARALERRPPLDRTQHARPRRGSQARDRVDPGRTPRGRRADGLRALRGHAFARLIYGKCRVMASDATDEGLTLRIRGPFSVMSRVKHDLGKAQ